MSYPAKVEVIEYLSICNAQPLCTFWVIQLDTRTVISSSSSNSACFALHELPLPSSRRAMPPSLTPKYAWMWAAHCNTRHFLLKCPYRNWLPGSACSDASKHWACCHSVSPHLLLPPVTPPSIPLFWFTLPSVFAQLAISILDVCGTLKVEPPEHVATRCNVLLGGRCV